MADGAAVPQPPAAPEDRHVVRMEIIISWVLRIGVVTSLAIVAAGLVLVFARHPERVSSVPALQTLTQPGAVFPHTLPAVFAGVAQLRGQAIVALGLLLLILTPVMRVAVSILAFALQRDRIFTLITAVVLIILLLSFVIGHATR